MIGCAACPHPSEVHSPDDGACTACECPTWAEPLLAYPANDLDDLVCESCLMPLPRGVPIARHPDGVRGGELVEVIRCVYCPITRD